MKKMLSSLTVLSFLVFPAFGTASAETRVIENQNDLDESGQQVLEDYEEFNINQSQNGDVKTRNQTSALSNRLVFERGSFLAWSEGIVTWNYNGSTISASDASQDSGYVFPNIVREEGIAKLGTSTSTNHEYRHKTTIGAGTVTPWGDVTVYETGYTDYLNVQGDGGYSVR